MVSLVQAGAWLSPAFNTPTPLTIRTARSEWTFYRASPNRRGFFMPTSLDLFLIHKGLYLLNQNQTR